MSLSRPIETVEKTASTYMRAPGVPPVRIQTYPKRRPGFINDTRLASLVSPRPVASIRPIADEPCYADFLVSDADSRMVVGA
jgi:hypothetical protein